MAVHLPTVRELQLARELCAYGRRLSPALSPPQRTAVRGYVRGLRQLPRHPGRRGRGGAGWRSSATRASRPPPRRRAGGRLPGGGAGQPVAAAGAAGKSAGGGPQAFGERGRPTAGVPRRGGVVRNRSATTGRWAEAAREKGDAVHFLAGLLGEAQKSPKTINHVPHCRKAHSPVTVTVRPSASIRKKTTSGPVKKTPWTSRPRFAHLRWVTAESNVHPVTRATPSLAAVTSFLRLRSRTPKCRPRRLGRIESIQLAHHRASPGKPTPPRWCRR